MSVWMKAGALAATAFIVALGSEAANEATGSDSFSLITAAEARVGRPLTPVSVAGVARRSARN